MCVIFALLLFMLLKFEINFQETMVNVEKRVFKRKLKKMQEAVRIKKRKESEMENEVKDEHVSILLTFYISCTMRGRSVRFST